MLDTFILREHISLFFAPANSPLDKTWRGFYVLFREMLKHEGKFLERL